MNRLISASAGSGKTYALTTHYLRLLRAQHKSLLRGEIDSLRVETLLTATFTRKAAGEIFERVLARLAAAALRAHGLNDLRMALKEDTLQAEDCEHLLHILCRSLNRVSVGTIDSFFQRLCQVYRQEAGLRGDLRMSEPKSPRCLALQKEAIDGMMKAATDQEEVARLFEILAGQKASLSVISNLLRILQDISETVGDAAPEQWDRLAVPQRPQQDEINAALAKLKTEPPHADDKRWGNAIVSDLGKFANGDWAGFCNAGIAAACLGGRQTYYSREITPAIKSLYEPLLAAAKHEVLAALRARALAIRDIHEKYETQYKALRAAESILLFSETTGLLGAAITDVADVARRVGNPVEHMLLDEFQDTSDPQWKVLKLFATAASADPRSVLVVGDAKQAIYGWRGGRAEIFDQIENDIRPINREVMEKSYRSSQVVIETVQSVFQQISQNAALASDADTASEWQKYVAKQSAAKEMRGYVELAASPVPPEPATGDSDEVEISGSDFHLSQCADRIAEETRRLPAGTSIGVLARTNATVAAMTDLLRKRGVPVSSEGRGKIADDPAVELILSALLLADHPGHTAAAYHVAHSPLSAVIGLAPGAALDPHAAASVASAIRLQILSDGYPDVVGRWAAALAPFGPHRTARRLEQVVELAASFDTMPLMRPAEFVRAVRESSADDPGAAPVRVMTINGAKGLEFDVVFLPELDFKIPHGKEPIAVQRSTVQEIAAGKPPVRAIYAQPDKVAQSLCQELADVAAAARAEEVTGMLCLLYVAMTRPRHALHMLIAPPKAARPSWSGVPTPQPAAILRSALAPNPPATAQVSGWTKLYENGDLDWFKGGDIPAKPLPAVADQESPILQLRQSSGLRRGFLPTDAEENRLPRTVAEALELA